MKDTFGREIDYMRVSITDRCNLRCRYCLPCGASWLPEEELLTAGELVLACRAAAAAGISKIKITGGEPLVREDWDIVARRIRELPGIRQVTMTTNGVLLASCEDKLRQSRLDAVNVSLDTLDREQFRLWTGSDALQQVLEGIETVCRLGIPLKINVVLQAEEGKAQWRNLVEFARERPVDVRFIELMPLGQGRQFRGVSGDVLLQEMERTFGTLQPDHRTHGNGPAVYYRIPGFCGSIGVIRAIHGKFCQGCNRIRMGADGQLKPCLCYGASVSLRDAVRKGSVEEAEQKIREAVRQKPREHCFENPEQITEKREMAKIGG